MQKNAIVKKLNINSKKQNLVLVEPVSFSECASCKQACNKRGILVEAVNKKNLPLKEGSLVLIASSKSLEAIESIISLVFPILMAILGYILSTKIYSFLQKFIHTSMMQSATCPEGIKALCVVLFFALSSLLVLKITRRKNLFFYPEITNVL